MTDPDPEEDRWEGRSGDDEQSEEGEDEEEVVQDSGSHTSDNPILCLTDRNEEDTDWTCDDVSKPDS
jgi:hypothetical protein